MLYLILPRIVLFYAKLLLGLFVACTQAFCATAVCNSSIYCSGELLHTIQLAKIFPDSKVFVDLKLIRPEEDILTCFQRLMNDTQKNPTRSQLMDFLDQHFEDKEELNFWKPPDFQATPPILYNIKNLDLLIFARDIISIWPMLGRKVTEDVAWNPGQYSFIYIPNGFIVPGGRFKELYYWDSYWIIRGLLISNMTQTAKGMIDNFIYIVKRLGYVPNGSRIYYLGRSQPPFLTWMVFDYFTATGDKAWLRSNIGIVEKELLYWLDEKKLIIEVNGIQYKLLRYVADFSKGPRSESYYEDFMNARFVPEKMRDMFYREIKSAAESGWDFSSRWLKTSDMKTEFNVTQVNISAIIPVDLNSIFASALKKMGDLKNQLQDKLRAKKYWSLAKQWRYAIDKFMWDNKDGVWYDYDSETKSRRKNFYLSCAAPLWADAVEPYHTIARGKRFVKYLRSTGVLKYHGGIPASLIPSGEQWDFPNAWPPLQSMLIGALDKSNCKDGKLMSLKLARSWVHANYIGYKKSQMMFEKYNCENAGVRGGGGEYTVQNGFGWTNGVLLELINRYGDDLDLL